MKLTVETSWSCGEYDFDNVSFVVDFIPGQPDRFNPPPGEPGYGPELEISAAYLRIPPDKNKAPISAALFTQQAIAVMHNDSKLMARLCELCELGAIERREADAEAKAEQLALRRREP